MASRKHYQKILTTAKVIAFPDLSLPNPATPPPVPLHTICRNGWCTSESGRNTDYCIDCIRLMEGCMTDATLDVRMAHNLNVDADLDELGLADEIRARYLVILRRFVDDVEADARRQEFRQTLTDLPLSYQCSFQLDDLMTLAEIDTRIERAIGPTDILFVAASIAVMARYSELREREVQALECAVTRDRYLAAQHLSHVDFPGGFRSTPSATTRRRTSSGPLDD